MPGMLRVLMELLSKKEGKARLGFESVVIVLWLASSFFLMDRNGELDLELKEALAAVEVMVNEPMNKVEFEFEVEGAEFQVKYDPNTDDLDIQSDDIRSVDIEVIE